MGNYRSKEDDVARISMSIYVTNFSDSFSAKDLFHLCKQYGHVVDSFIPIKRSKNENSGSGNTYVQVVKGDVKTGGRVKEFASLANLKVALCNEGSVNIKIKYMGELWVLLEFVTRESIKLFHDNVSVGSWFSQIIEASRDFVTNRRIAWVKVEGVPFKLWSHNTFKRIADRWGKLLDVDDQDETCYHSKRLCIHTKSGRNILESFKIIHRGKAHWIRACETPGWVPNFADESDDEDQEDNMSNDGGAKEHIPGGGGDVNEQEDDLVSGFEEEKHADNNVEEGDVDDQENKSEDPFQIYKLLHKNNKVDRNEGVSDDSLKWPPGFTPYGSNDADSSNVVGDNNVTVKVERVNTIYEANEVSGGGSILGILDEVVKIRQAMGYNMEGYYFVMLRGVWRMTRQLVLLIVVYAPQEVSEKRLLWDYLQSEIRKWNGEVVIMGDFNEVRHPGECRRAAGTCFKYGQAGHLQKDCKKDTTASTSGQADKKPGALS
nr:nucleotide-binding alpha-beta plait domain-containing protein [Tanacetum cinerariifolium]